MKIEVKYDGEYPNLCSGHLTIVIDGKTWKFPNYCLSSGGGVGFDDDWHEIVTTGVWYITEYPENFPEELKPDVLNAVNMEIPHGCCGGCV